MSITRFVIYSFAVFVSSLLPGMAGARDSYFSPNCGSCHIESKRTCNGCHVHGTHPGFLASEVGTMNLRASTGKATYVEGDPIAVTLEGSNMADFSGWVGVRIYDASGAEVTRKQAQLACAPYPAQLGDKCDLPMTLSVPAKLGWTQLYAAWAGNQFDRSGAAFGTLLGTTFGAGRRPLRDSSGNQVALHIEEIVATGTFTVTPAPPQPTPAPTPTPTPTPGTGTGGNNGSSSGGGQSPPTSSTSTQQSGGSGAFDWAVFGVLVITGVIFARRATPSTR